MICKLLDKLNETLRPKEAILLLAIYERSGMEWAERNPLVDDLIAFSAEDTKHGKIATNRLVEMGFIRAEIRMVDMYRRCKFVQLTEDGRRFLNECYKHAQGKRREMV
jgi:DNA-binding MarR family transcriptional regulator